MAIKDSPVMSRSLDPPEYSTEVGEYSPISVHFERPQSPGTPSSKCPFSRLPQRLPPGNLLSHRQSLLLDLITPPTSRVFTYGVQRKGRTWAELKVTADELISKSTPTFVEGSRIEGQVSLYAAKPESIHSVLVSIKGQVITGTHTSEHLTFFEVSQMVWSKSLRDPRKGSACTATETIPSSPYAEKLCGTFTWPFSLEIPREVVLSPKIAKNGPRVFRPPESYFERHGRASIRYEICVRFVRGHFRSDNRIHATFNYIPMAVPGPPSPLRQLAYEHGSPLLGPRADPSGWHECKTIKLKGCMHRLRDVEVYCTLYVARPLTYTRGAVIPCWLRLRSRDIEALDNLANPKAIVMRLQRCVKATDDYVKATENPSWKDQKELSELGIWWPVSESMNARELSGELHLNIDLKPSSAMAHFRIEYSAVLFPFDTLTFEMVVTAPLIEQPVEIVTGYAPGPRPRMYAPPDYESPDAVAMNDQLSTLLTTGL